MKQIAYLSPSQPTTSLSLSFAASGVSIFNPTAYTVYVRMGAPEVPTDTNYTYAVMPASAMNLPASGGAFGFSLSANPTLLASAALSLGSTVTITVYDAKESPPSFGGASFSTLPVSDNLGGPWLNIADAAKVLGPFDLDNWGGLLIAVDVGDLTNVTTNYPLLTVEHSPDGLAFATVRAFPLWRGGQYQIAIPRVGRYVRLSYTADANAGVSIWVRATVTEIPAVMVNPIELLWETTVTDPGGSKSLTVDCRGLNGISFDIALLSYVGGTAFGLDIATTKAPGLPSQLMAKIARYGNVATTERITVPAGLGYLVFTAYGVDGQTCEFRAFIRAIENAALTVPPEWHRRRYAAINVTNVTTRLADGNATRKYLLIVNDGTAPIYINQANGAAVANQGIRINPDGGAYEMYGAAGNLRHEQIEGIASTPGPYRVLVTELG